MTTNLDVFTAIDCEFNQPSGSLIQIGAAVGNIKTETIIDKFSVFVNPHETLNPFITTLTGITQEDVDHRGLSLQEAYQNLIKFHAKYSSFMNPVTWGQGDMDAIRTQLGPEWVGIYGWPFGRRIIDVKTLYVSWRLSQNLPIQGGLAKAMTRVGLQFQGHKHDATDDAANTLRMFFNMLK